MGNVFTKRINEPQLDTLAAKRILEKTFIECGILVTPETIDEMLKSSEQVNNHKGNMLIHKIAHRFEKHHIHIF